MSSDADDVVKLNPEITGVWSGWNGLGDREIVREASAKGTHIELAHKFLQKRRQCSMEEAKLFFAAEVDIWVNALLSKGQVHRASHILKNVGKNAVDSIKDVCLKTKDLSLRDKLAKHVESSFSKEEKEAWNILHLVEKYEQDNDLDSHLLLNMSLEEIMNLAQNVKDSIYTELYFQQYEPDVVAYLKSEIVWDYLLSTNNADLLKMWIDLSYGETDLDFFNSFNHRSDIQLLLSNLKINDEMLACIDSSNAMLCVKNIVLNHLCRYGVFVPKEQEDAKLILSRLFQQLYAPIDFSNVLSNPHCNIDKESFLSKVDIIGLSRTYNESDIKCIDMKIKKLWDSLRTVCSTEINQTIALQSGILETVNYLTDDAISYLKHNCIVTCTLIFLEYSKLRRSSNVSLKEIFNNDSGLQVGSLSIPKHVLDSVLSTLPYLKSEVHPKLKKCSTMYNLIDGYQNFDSSTFFKWRFKHGKMPDFQNESLCKKFGHKEQLNFINYLKEARPNMAVHDLTCHEKRFSNGITAKSKSHASLYAHIFALRHSQSLEIVSGCISFIELLGMSSENLRLHIEASKIIRRELNIYIENSLELIIYNNQQELKLVLNYLEQSFNSRLTIKILSDNDEFMRLLRDWEIVVKFAKYHNAVVPKTLLKFLALNEAWFEFVLVAHIFSYPINQVVDCVQYFESASLKEHLTLSLKNSYSTVKNQATENQKQQRIPKKRFIMTNSETTECVPENLSPSHYPDTNVVNFSDDLWLIILKCHQSEDPPGALLEASKKLRSPILTVLATCYEPSSVSSYCWTWLIVSAENLNIEKDYAEYLESQIWTANTVLNLICAVVSNGFTSTLYRGLQIFLPENPLKLFAQYLTSCVEYGDFYDRQQYLSDFIKVCSNYKHNNFENWSCSDASYLEHVHWIHTVAVKCVIVTLSDVLKSTRTQIEFLNSLISAEFHKKLMVTVPDLESLVKYLEILSETPVQINFHSFDKSATKIDESEAEIIKCINDLVELEDYATALKLSNAALLNASEIILAQCRSGFAQNADQDGNIDPKFWNRCFADFKSYDVCYERAAEFFVEHAEKVKSHKDRYEILKLALELLQNDSKNRQSRDTVEMAMWKSCILAGSESIEIKAQDRVFKKLRTELLSSVSELQVTCTLDNEEERKSIDTLILRLLDAGKLDTALRIGAIFNFRNRDLQVLMLCLSLAEGEFSPYQLNAQQRDLLSDSNKPKQRSVALMNRGLKKMSSTSSLNKSFNNSQRNNVSDTSSPTMTPSQQEQADCLELLTNLIETLNHGLDIGVRVCLCYKIALQVGRTYQVLLTLNNPMQYLQDIISGSNDAKLEIARDIITAYQIDNQMIAHFLAEEILAHITQVIEDESSNGPSGGLYYNMNLQSVIELCRDTSILGLRLLDMANKLLGHSNGEKRNLVTLKIIVELLVRSHDCFTTSCNMEGIASVLRKCQQLSNSLQKLKHWSLLVRLITGVGRFTEMSYIFQILKENEQFEFLLGRGLDKVPGLRMALLDFLKRNCPEDKDLFNIVALHFRLYYELALTWESEAKEVINELISESKVECLKGACNTNVELKFTRNEKTEKRLQLAIANLTHATRYYLEDNKLNLANRCSHQAQLVALQISLLFASNVNANFPCLLNLSTEEINRAISHHLSFSQALIVARAYEHHVDWAGAIYSHCLLKGETKYLRDFLTSKCLAASVAVDCARRYRQEKVISKSMAENMQTLVAKVDDYECKYVLASQLGFKKIVKEMLNDAGVEAYLKDTVFKRRYAGNEIL